MVNLKEEGASLDFLGFTFRYYDDLKGRGRRYLNVSPSEKAVKREREKLHDLTDHRQCFKPIPELIEELNRHLKGWKNYFDFGYPRVAFGEINTYVRDRLMQHLKRRSQRPFRPPEGRTMAPAFGRLGLIRLSDCACLRREFSGEPDAGNPLLRFDEGRVGRATRVAFSPTLPPDAR